MGVLENNEQREMVEREEKQRARLREAAFRRDVQQMLQGDATRRVLYAFLVEAGVDVSAYREAPSAMAHAVGWQDAAAWWLNLVRQHCPEREAQMRAEARKQAREDVHDEEDDEH